MEPGNLESVRDLSRLCMIMTFMCLFSVWLLRDMEQEVMGFEQHIIPLVYMQTLIAFGSSLSNEHAIDNPKP